MAWNPETYLKFQNERFAPFEDLARMVRVQSGLSAVDLGCGTGELTARLQALLPESQVLGVDSSDAMLEKARALAGPALRFEKGEIERVSGTWDLVFSNAAIQWVDDHESLIPRLLSLVNPGGQIVIQLPSNQEHCTHTAILDLAAEEPFLTALGGWRRQFPVLKVAQYAELLFKHGASDIVIFEKVYPHILPDADALAEWMRGTALVPYMERMKPESQRDFLDAYRKRLRARWPASPVFFGFNRILFSATIRGKGQ